MLLPGAPEGIVLWRERSAPGESSSQSQRNAHGVDKVLKKIRFLRGFLEFFRNNSQEKPQGDVEIEEKAAQGSGRV